MGCDGRTRGRGAGTIARCGLRHPAVPGVVRRARIRGARDDTPTSRARQLADAYYDGGRFPFTDGRFATVLCNQVLEHVFNPDEFIREICRVLTPEGRLLRPVSADECLPVQGAAPARPACQPGRHRRADGARVAARLGLGQGLAEEQRPVPRPGGGRRTNLLRLVRTASPHVPRTITSPRTSRREIPIARRSAPRVGSARRGLVRCVLARCERALT